MPTIKYIPAQLKGAHDSSSLKNKYYARPVLAGTITASELNDLISLDSGVERSEVALVTDAVCKQIKELVCNGHSIQVGTLGTFSIGMKAKVVPTEKEVKADTIKELKVRLYESTEIKNDLKATRFVADDMVISQI